MKSLKKKGFVLKRAGEKPKKKKQEGKKRSCKRTRERTFRRRLEKKKGTKIFFSKESYMYDYCNSYVHFHLSFLICAWLVEFDLLIMNRFWLEFLFMISSRKLI